MIEVRVIPLCIVLGFLFFFLFLSVYLFFTLLESRKKKCKNRLVEVIIDDESVGRGEKITVYLRFILPPKMVKEIFPAHCRLALMNVFLALYPDFVDSLTVGDERDERRRVILLREDKDATESTNENSERGA